LLIVHLESLKTSTNIKKILIQKISLYIVLRNYLKKELIKFLPEIRRMRHTKGKRFF